MHGVAIIFKHIRNLKTLITDLSAHPAELFDSENLKIIILGLQNNYSYQDSQSNERVWKYII